MGIKYRDAQLLHRINSSVVHVQSAVLFISELDFKVLNELGCIKSSVFSDNVWELAESSGVALNSQGLLALDVLRQFHTSGRHLHLAVASSKDHQLILDSLNKHTECIMQ